MAGKLLPNSDVRAVTIFDVRAVTIFYDCTRLSTSSINGVYHNGSQLSHQLVATLSAPWSFGSEQMLLRADCDTATGSEFM
jgi:hypothetical protein